MVHALVGAGVHPGSDYNISFTWKIPFEQRNRSIDRTVHRIRTVMNAGASTTQCMESGINR
jgi:hypothetical protein